MAGNGPVALRLAERHRDVQAVLRLDLGRLHGRVGLAHHAHVLRRAAARRRCLRGGGPRRTRGRERTGSGRGWRSSWRRSIGLSPGGPAPAYHRARPAMAGGMHEQTTPALRLVAARGRRTARGARRAPAGLRGDPEDRRPLPHLRGRAGGRGDDGPGRHADRQRLRARHRPGAAAAGGGDGRAAAGPVREGAASPSPRPSTSPAATTPTTSTR